MRRSIARPDHAGTESWRRAILRRHDTVLEVRPLFGLVVGRLVPFSTTSIVFSMGGTQIIHGYYKLDV
jgi:hypothetical protein